MVLPIIVVVFSFIAAIVLVPMVIFTFAYLHMQRKANKKEFQAIQSEILQVRADIDDVKEQLADFIIKTS